VSSTARGAITITHYGNFAASFDGRLYIIGSELKKRDLYVVKPDEAAARLIDRAVDLFVAIPALLPIVRRCVQEIVLLHVSDDAYDVTLKHRSDRRPDHSMSLADFR
jgi:hypothetical protein